jgi:hypothetical protein
MKKLIGVGLLLSLLLVACSSESSEPVEEETKVSTEETKKDEPTQEELNAQLKEEATKANFVELNSDDTEKGQKIFTVGTIDVVIKEGMLGEFSFTTEEDEGYGMYTVVNVMGTEVTKGDKVKIYGVYDGKDESGFPIINATIIEQL